MSETPQPQEKRESVWDSALKVFAHRGLILIVLLFIIEITIFFVVSALPFFPGEQAAYANQSNQTGTQFQGASLPTQFWGIFSNNYGIALRELVPGLGLVNFALPLYATARVLEVVSVQDHVSPFVLVLVLLLLFPHSWLELPAYAVAAAENILIVYACVRWLADSKGSAVSWRSELGLFVINFVIITVMLFVAALFESVELQIGLLFWVTWIPFAAIIVLVALLFRRLLRMTRKKDRPEILLQ